MKRAAWLAGSCLLALLVSGCAGDGSAIDDIMNPPDDDNGSEMANLAWIQDNVFTPICTECHVPGGPGPMPLTGTDVSFQSLVGQASVGSALLRVSPGEPDNSYLVHKIEGRPGIGGIGRMPPSPRPMLPQESIDAIVQWIVDGAQP